MTNEEIAAEILSGSRELCPLLWDKVNKYLHSRARRFYNANRERCKRAGVQLEDIEQECYFVFLQGLKYWKPESGYSFITFLNLPFRNACRALLGVRSTKRPDPLNSSESLDRPAAADDSEGATLGDLQADESSTEFVDRLEAAAISEIIREAVEELPDNQRKAVQLYYFEGLTLEQIGARLGVSGERARQLRYNGEHKLKRSKELKQLYIEYYQQRYYPRWQYYDWQPEHYGAARAEREQLQRSQSHAAALEALQLEAELAEMLQKLREYNSGATSRK